MNKKLLILVILLSTFFINCSEDTLDADIFGSIAGTVIDDDTNEPLSNVKVTTSPASNTVFTNDIGEFTINMVLVDNYSVEAELDEYVTGFEGVEVLEGRESEVVFELVLSETDNSAPSPPVLVSPENGEVDLPLEVDLIWESLDADDDEITYNITLRNGTTNELEEFEVVADTMFTVSNLSLSTNYFWQISAKDELNDPVSSELSSFKTFSAQNNPFLFIKRVEDNNVIFSGDQGDDQDTDDVDVNVLQLTSEDSNSYRPKKNNDVNKIAFIRTVGGENHIFTMDVAGTDIEQITSAVPIAGFRQESIEFTWAENGQRIYYPNFNKLYSIDNNGGGLLQFYTTPDGSFISDIAVSQFNNDIIILKTNNVDGYDVRIYAISRSTGLELFTVLENEPGAVSGIDVDANLESVIYSRDITGSINSDYRIFQSRIFRYNVNTQITTNLVTNVVVGENDLFPSYSPDEGRLVLTRVLNNFGAIPSIYKIVIGDTETDDQELFTSAFMPDWE